VPSDLLFSHLFLDFLSKVGFVETFLSNPRASNIPLHLFTTASMALGVFCFYVACVDLKDILGALLSIVAQGHWGVTKMIASRLGFTFLVRLYRGLPSIIRVEFMLERLYFLALSSAVINNHPG
jgi:hypothetical protein